MSGYATDGTLIYMGDQTAGTPSGTFSDVAAASGVVTVTATNTFSKGDLVHIAGAVGMPELNGYHLVASATGTDFTLDRGDLADTWTSGGVATPMHTSRIQLGCYVSFNMNETINEIDIPCADDPSHFDGFALGNARGALTVQANYLVNDAAYDPKVGVNKIFQSRQPVAFWKETPQVSTTPSVEACYAYITGLASSGNTGAPQLIDITGRLLSHKLFLSGS